jgi:Co/Zn/Cd efflux system component
LFFPNVFPRSVEIAKSNNAKQLFDIIATVFQSLILFIGSVFICLESLYRFFSSLLFPVMFSR